MPEQDQILNDQLANEYKYGFVTDIESDKAPKGLSEDTIRFISAKKKRTRMVIEMAIGSIRTMEKNDRTSLGAC
jgi:Fe-S cluster assembly protein SufB